MKIFFTYQGEQKKFFFSLEVSESSTVSEILEIPRVKRIIESVSHEIVIVVNGEILDGNFKPIPERFRLSEGQRVELYRPLNQDPKERRRQKA